MSGCRCSATYLYVPEQTLQEGSATVREHCCWYTFPRFFTLQAQPVTGACMHSYRKFSTCSNLQEAVQT